MPAADWPEGAQRPVFFVEGAFPRITSHDRGPGYEPQGERDALSAPLGYIPQVAHTYAYWDTNYGAEQRRVAPRGRRTSFTRSDERFASRAHCSRAAVVNEVGLAFSESTCGAKTIGFSPRHGGSNLLCIEELTKVALERCDTARCAVSTMGALAEEYGYFNTESGTPGAFSLGGSAECLLVSDPHSVWHFHVATHPSGSGAVWAAQRVPDGHVTAQPNSFVIRSMNLAEPHTYLASADVVNVAITAGFYSPPTSGTDEFDFTSAFGYFNATAMKLGPHCPEELNLYTGRRMWRVFDTVAPSLGLDPDLGFVTTRRTYPLSVAPDSPVSLATVKALLRDHYEGTPYDLTSGLAAGPFGNPTRWGGGVGEKAVGGAWERAISMHRTTWSFIVESRVASADVPAPAAVRVWFGYDSPATTVYQPMYASQRVVPPSWSWGRQCVMSRTSSFWAFNFVKNWVELRWAAMMVDVRAAQAAKEADLFDATEAMEAQVAALIAASSSSPSSSTPNNHGGAGGGSGGNTTDAIEAGRMALEAFAVDAAERTTLGWWDLADTLVAKFSNGYVCGEGCPEGDRASPGYPAEWLKAVGAHIVLRPPGPHVSLPFRAPLTRAFFFLSPGFNDYPTFSSPSSSSTPAAALAPAGEAARCGAGRASCAASRAARAVADWLAGDARAQQQTNGAAAKAVGARVGGAQPRAGLVRASGAGEEARADARR